jgi:hypothetical protein
LCLPDLDGRCFETLLEHLGEVYADHRLVLVLDNAPSHLSREIALPQSVELLPLPGRRRKVVAEQESSAIRQQAQPNTSYELLEDYPIRYARFVRVYLSVRQ